MTVPERPTDSRPASASGLPGGRGTGRTTDWGQPVLFGLLLAMFLVHPWAGGSPAGDTIIRLLYSAVLVGSLVVLDGTRVVLVIALVFLIPALALGPAGGARGALTSLGALCGVAFLCIVIAVMLRHVFTAARVTLHNVVGALSAFLMLGILWMFAYQAADASLENAFSGVSNDGVARGAQLFYFSFVTLTTLGYGDVTPARPETMSLAVVEAVVGQMYLVVLVAYLVARLVSAHGQEQVR